MKKNKNLILGCDKDGVINNFTGEYLRLYNGFLKQEISHFKSVDLKWEPEIYSFEKNPLIDKEIHKKVRLLFPEIMVHSNLYPGAKNFLFDLYRIFPDFILITHQFDFKTKLSTFEWLVQNELPYSCAFSSGTDKWKYCDILIDDKIENLEEMEDHGKIAICFARNWNKTYNGLRFESYEEIIKYLNKNYG
jgi:5'(3')-deoxyribonucleotidase